MRNVWYTGNPGIVSSRLVILWSLTESRNVPFLRTSPVLSHLPTGYQWGLLPKPFLCIVQSAVRDFTTFLDIRTRSRDYHAYFALRMHGLCGVYKRYDGVDISPHGAGFCE